MRPEGAVRVTLAKAGTRVGASVQPKRPKAGTRPRVVVRVSARGAVPDGVVRVVRGAKVLGKARLNARGVATVRITRQPAGKRQVRVVYAGSADFAKGGKVLTFRVRR